MQRNKWANSIQELKKIVPILFAGDWKRHKETKEKQKPEEEDGHTLESSKEEVDGVELNNEMQNEVIKAMPTPVKPQKPPKNEKNIFFT